MATPLLFFAGLIFGAISQGFTGAVFGALLGLCFGMMIARDGEIAALHKTVARMQKELTKLRPTQADAAPPVKTPPVEEPVIPVVPVIETPIGAGIAAPAAEPAMAFDHTESPTLTEEPTHPQPQRFARAAEPEKVAVFNPFAAAWAWLLGGNTLVRVGVVILFFGLAFLTKFVAEHTTLPVEFRYVGVAAIGVIALIVGWRLRERRPGYSMALQGFAVAVFYLTLFTGYRLHQLFPTSMVMALLILVCALSAILAILQDARSLAIIGVCGGFLAPVLASTGSGNHVALFSYYALLNAGIFGIAWLKAWRSLNVLGFLFTFGIGSAWGARAYRDELFASTEPFLILFFLFYLAIALLYGRRRHEELAEVAVTVCGERVDYVDGTLIFGTPLAAFGLQYLMVRDMPMGTAFSALGLAAIYIPLATLIYRRGGAELRLLFESFLALGVIFFSLAIPLALDAQWTSAAWAAEGAGIFWVCCRQNRPLGRAFALLLQLGAGIGFLRCLQYPGDTAWFGLHAVLNGPVLGAVLVGGAGILTGRLARKYQIGDSTADDLSILWGLFFINIVPPLLLDFQWSAVVWALAGLAAIGIGLRHARVAAPTFGTLQQIFAGIVFLKHANYGAPEAALWNAWWLGCFAFALAGFCSGLAFSRRDRTLLARLALTWSLLWWTVAGLNEIGEHLLSTYHLAAAIGFFAVTALTLMVLSRRLVWYSPCSASLMLVPALIACAIFSHMEQTHPAANYGAFAWPFALGVAALSLYRQQGWLSHIVQAGAHALMLWLIALLGTWEGVWCFRELGAYGSAWPLLGWILTPLLLLWLLSRPTLLSRWPLTDFPVAYRLAAIPIALGAWFWLIANNFTSTGNAAPLPYLPLINPLDIGTAGSLLILLIWLRSTSEQSPEAKRLIAAGLGLSCFLWLNGMLLRSLHHWAGIAFDLHIMLHSTLVQACFSLCWSLLALALMLTATRREQRPLWWTGGALMVLVVVKLFLVDLSRVGTVERIVSFIGVGILLLILGYFSPMPPKKVEATS